MNQPKKTSLKVLFHNLFQTLRLIYSANPKYFIVISIVTLIQGIIPVIQLNIGKYLLDSIISAIQKNGAPASLKTITFWLAVEFLAMFLNTFLDSVRRFLQTTLGNELVLHVNEKIFAKTITLGAAFFENPVFYDQLTKARQGAGQRPLQTFENLFSFFQNFITLFGLMGVLFVFNPLILLLLIVTIIPVLNVELHFSRKMYKIFEERIPEVRKKDYFGWLLSEKWTFKEMRLFNLADLFLQRYTNIASKHIAQDKAVNFKRSLIQNFITILLLCVYYGSYIYIIYCAVIKKITVGGLSMYMIAIKQIQNNLRSFLQSLSRLYEDNLYIANFFSFLALEPDIETQTPQVETLHEASLPKTFTIDRIEFQNVSFKYPGTEQYVLRQIDFTIQSGQNIALVGLNGSGKTTLVKLLCRFYDPTEGRILINGADIRSYDLQRLRAQISTIFQDYVRYELTVRENIGIGNIEDLENLELIEANARKSDAHEFITRLPDQYDTYLGRMITHGAELSIGQWQKIALARAFMRNSSLLILDEPTASLDPETEYQIFKKFQELTQGKISLIISHRFSTVRVADQIIVLRKGMIIEAGNHAELMAQNGEYARLFKLQADSYRTETAVSSQI